MWLSQYRAKVVHPAARRCGRQSASAHVKAWVAAIAADAGCGWEIVSGCRASPGGRLDCPWRTSSFCDPMPRADRRVLLVAAMLSLPDLHVGRALTLLHAAPALLWTVNKLAREAAISRATLAKRFVELLGESPMQ